VRAATSRAETTGGIIGDLLTMDGGRSTRALVQGEDVRGKSQELPQLRVFGTDRTCGALGAA